MARNPKLPRASCGRRSLMTKTTCEPSRRWRMIHARALAASVWPIAFDRHPTAGSRLRVVVPQRLMLEAAVVPEGDRMRLPAEPALEFLPGAEFAVDIECFALGHWMRAHDRVRCPRIDLAGLGKAHQRIVAAINMVA